MAPATVAAVDRGISCRMVAFACRLARLASRPFKNFRPAVGDAPSEAAPPGAKSADAPFGERTGGQVQEFCGRLGVEKFGHRSLSFYAPFSILPLLRQGMREESEDGSGTKKNRPSRGQFSDHSTGPAGFRNNIKGPAKLAIRLRTNGAAVRCGGGCSAAKPSRAECTLSRNRIGAPGLANLFEAIGGVAKPMGVPA